MGDRDRDLGRATVREARPADDRRACRGALDPRRIDAHRPQVLARVAGRPQIVRADAHQRACAVDVDAQLHLDPVARAAVPPAHRGDSHEPILPQREGLTGVRSGTHRRAGRRISPRTAARTADRENPSARVAAQR